MTIQPRWTCAVVYVCAILPRLATAQIVVGHNRQVSTPNAQRSHYELWADVDPTNPARMLACSFVAIDSGVATVVYASGDGGRTWVQTKLSDDLRTGGPQDPICTFGQDGAAYYVEIRDAGRPEEAQRGMWIYRSADGGATWSEPSRLPFVDRPYLVTDGTHGKYHGRVYINGTGDVRALAGDGVSRTFALYTSHDGGRTFGGPVQRAGLADGLDGMGNSVVLSDGTVASIFGMRRGAYDPERGFTGYVPSTLNKPNAWIKVITSTDGGTSLNPAVTIDEWSPGMERSQGAIMPQLAADQSDSPFKDRLYAVWTDFRTGRLEIRLAYSVDKGKTWSKSQVLNDDRIALDPAAKGPDAMTPIVAVNKRGVVGVAWYDRREHPDNLGWYERFSASLDGGETWLPSVRVSEKPNTYTGKEAWPVGAHATTDGSMAGQPLSLIVNISPFFYTGGHTGAMASDTNGVFYPFWFDNRTGLSQIWTAPVTVTGAAVKNGSAQLAMLEDITPKVTLDFTKTSYDHSTRQVTVMARLKNVSKDTVHAPVKLRVLRMASDVGVPVLVGAESRQSGGGAVLDFSTILHDGVLLPDSTSDATTLIFRLTDLRPLRQGNELKYDLIDLGARLLGE